MKGVESMPDNLPNDDPKVEPEKPTKIDLTDIKLSPDEASLEFAGKSVSPEAVRKLVNYLNAKNANTPDNVIKMKDLENKFMTALQNIWMDIKKIYEERASSDLRQTDKDKVIELATDGFIKVSLALKYWPKNREFSIKKQNFIDEISQYGGEFPKIVEKK